MERQINSEPEIQFQTSSSFIDCFTPESSGAPEATAAPYHEHQGLSLALSDLELTEAQDSTELASLSLQPERGEVDDLLFSDFRKTCLGESEKNRLERNGMKFGPGEQFRDKNGIRINPNSLKPNLR